MKSSVLFLFLALAVTCFSQNKNYEKAKKSFAEGNLKAANKLVDKVMEDREMKENPNVLLLKSRIMFAMLKDKTLLEKYPSALKEAMKYAEKALEANPSETAKTAFKVANAEYLSELIKKNNIEALEAYNTKKYGKALPLFKKSLAFGLDTQSMVLAGDCYWQLGQESESVPYFKRSAELIYTAVLDSNSRVYGYFREPFRKLGKYYIDREQYDSAYVIVKNGREILPSDPVLTEYTYKMMRYALDKVPPSEDYLNLVKSGLRDFPTDSFLNHRENSIYIFLLNSHAIANEQVLFDSMLSRYADAKKAKAKLKTIETIKKYDIWAGQDKLVFVNNLKNYFAEIDLPEATYATFMFQNSSIPYRQEGFILKTKNDIMRIRIMDEKNIKVAEFFYNTYLRYNPKDAAVIKNRSEYVAAKNKSILAYYDLLPTINLNDASAKDFPKDPSFKAKAKELRLRLINETTDSGDFRLSRRIWNESRTLYPDQAKTLDAQWRKMVETDFRTNYFGSRVNLKGKGDKNVPEYGWTGNVDSCRAGTMSMDVVLRVEQRINYFRRNAGVTEEIVLTTQDNEYCQYAALMCEANKTMSHEPNDGWRCYIPAGADALKNSILSKDANPSIAITAAMGQNHATVGNRRWLLYPNALYMGIGTSRSFSVIKAVDNSHGIDSNKYKTTFVAWPPANYCPKMLVFKKWSFSIDLNLAGATVSMKDSKGQSITLKQEANTLGYGMNTIVWEPEINAAALIADTDYTVTIKLASGKTFTYVVKVIDVKI